MSLFDSKSYASESVESSSSKRESSSNGDYLFEQPLDKLNSQGFSSSIILNLENDLEKSIRPCSKLLNITKIVPESQNPKKIMLPIFYRRSVSSIPSGKLLILESSFSSGSHSNESIKENAEGKNEIKKEVFKPNRVTSTTAASMHTLSNIDPEQNHEFFTEKIKCDYEYELKSSMHEGNLIAYCHKCKKETVTVMQAEKKTIRSLKDILACCCSTWTIKPKNFSCPTCAEILIKYN
jgi:hypothetical protein